MALVRPYVTDKFTSYKGDEIITSLSLAIWLIDDYTKKEPIGNIKVRIKEREIKAVKNLSRYYIFTDLDAGNYTVNIESDFYSPLEKKVEILKAVDLKFATKGPKAGSTSVKLKDVSKLGKGDAVEFRNPGSETEKRTTTDIDVSKKKISWTGGLKHDFSVVDSTVVAHKNPVVEIILKPISAYPFPDNATLVRGRVLNIDPKVPPTVKVGGRIETKTDEQGEFVLYLKGVKDSERDNEKIKIEIGDKKSIEINIPKEKEKISLGVISSS